MQNAFTEGYYMTSMAEAFASYINQDYCLVILDDKLAKINDMELLRTIRSTRHVPILILANNLIPEEKIALYHAGADAYIDKPLNMDICVAQANALIQLFIEPDIKQTCSDIITFGTELVICPRYRQVIIEGKPLTLTRKEFDLLCFLASSPGQVFSRSQI